MAASIAKSELLNELHKMFVKLELNSDSADTESFKRNVLFKNTWVLTPSNIDIPKKLYKCDCFTFMKFLEKNGHIDETNLKLMQDTIKSMKLDQYELVTTETYNPVKEDPVVDYLKRTAPPQTFEQYRSWPFDMPCRRSGRLKRKRKETTSERIEKRLKERAENSSQPVPNTSSSHINHQSVYSCDVRLRVKVEYVDHQTVLGNSVHSHKENEIERQFEKFTQASNILKSRDLGTVVCDIKFSELTSLDAFWRDYTNGALLEALNVVFITDSLSEAVGHEPLRLLVSVDEDDYIKGRIILLKNLTG